MAERRMFAKTIIDSDAFLDMPQSSQLLYFHLSMRADDDGFINNPRSIMRNVKCNEDDLKLLIVKKFIIQFESGIVVIKHWKIHNYIQKDRYKETKYKDEKSTLSLDENNAYTQSETQCIQDVYISDTQDRLGKDRLGKDRLGKDRLGKVNDYGTAKRFTPPTFDEVRDYCLSRNNNIDPEYFIDYYERQDWKLSNGQKMKNWKAAVRTWEHNNYGNNKKQTSSPRTAADELNDFYDMAKNWAES